MDFVTAKSQQATAMAAGMLTSTRATVEDFANEFGKNPDKSRALLNLLFVPHFKPSFVDDRPLDVTDPDDVELLAPAAAKPLRYPVRMFDLDTGNLVEYPDIGALGQYCILSHSWKGSEVDYGYINRARAQAAGQGTLREDDVTLIKRLAKSDVEEQAEKITALAAEVVGEIGLSAADDVVTRLLLKRRNVTWLTDEFNSARKEEEKAKSKQKLREMAANAFNDLTEDIEEQVSGDIGQTSSAAAEKTADPEEEDPSCQTPHSAQTEAGEATTRAKAALDAADADVAFFQKHVWLREAVDAMVYCLQRWKSTVKIEQSIRRARDIFDTKGFASCDKRYLWNDTCCINKVNPAELVESLSIMGDWYAHAEFCLVHLDTRRLPQYCPTHRTKRCTVPSCDIYRDREKSADEWLDEWAIFNGQPRKPNLSHYGQVREYIPEWAERGWTLQELVLSKTTFYVNSAWMPLERPVADLGPYYYICPFIEACLYSNKGQSRKDANGLRGFWDVEALTRLAGAGNTKARAVVRWEDLEHCSC